MAIPVRIEAKAWTDPRYQALAIELGMARARHALIAVADIWQWQTEHYTDERPTYCVPRAVIVGALEHRDGPEAMVAAGLAEAMPDGTYRIRGGRDDKGKSRIDWLYRDRMAQSERGRRRADRAASEGRQGGRFASRAPAGHQPEGVHEPAAPQPATSSPDSGLQSPEPESPSPRACAGGEATDRTNHVQVAPSDAIAGAAAGGDVGRLFELARDRLNDVRREIDPASMPLPDFPGHGHELLARLREAGPQARQRLEIALDRAIARARKQGLVDALQFSTFASAAAWSFIQGSSVEGFAAAGGRGGSRTPASKTRHADANTRLEEQLDRVRRLRAEEESQP